MTRRVALLVALLVVAGASAVVVGRSDDPFCADPPAPEVTSTDLDVALEVVDETPGAVDIAPTGPDELILARRSGQIVSLVDGQERPLLDLTGSTTTDGENGLLSIAPSPDGQEVVLGYTDLLGDLRVAEFDLPDEVGQQLDPAALRHVLTVPQVDNVHNGGSVRFGPDGYLYIGVGEGGRSEIVFGEAQTRSSLHGAILRVDPRSQGTVGYQIPEDNPFTADPEARDELWTYGLRNPWRFSFDQETGDLWIADVGEKCLEEVTRLAPGDQAGANLGWAIFEGTERFAEGDADGLTEPMLVYPHTNEHGCAVTGGVVYRGSAIPELVGNYVFGDLCRPELWALDPADGTAMALPVEVPSTTSVVEDVDGELLITSLSDGVVRVVPDG